MVMGRWLIFGKIGLIATAVWLASNPGNAYAVDVSRVVYLPDEAPIDLGAYAKLVERAVDRGELDRFVRGYLNRGLPADAAAVLAYAVRSRPDRAEEIADTAVRLIAQFDEIAFARGAFTALAAEPAMTSEILGTALNKVVLSDRLRDAAAAAASLPLPSDVPKEVVTAGAVEEMDLVTAADVAAETDEAEEAGGAFVQPRTAGDIFGNDVLPDTLRIGDGQAGVGGAGTSSDGGAS